MKEPTLINIEWDGPYSLEKVVQLKEPTDKGVYQIYGGHPVYGAGVLLYIGLTADQTFGERLPREECWEIQLRRQPR